MFRRYSLPIEKGDTMNENNIKIRLMTHDDFNPVTAIDQKVLKVSRKDYYTQKFELLFKSGEYLPTSLVAENENHEVVGYIMGELYIGEFGISRTGASIDTVGVDPDYQKQGIGKMLMDEFVTHLKELGVKRINTLVDRDDRQMTRYFTTNDFSPSKAVINLERNI